jgi:hypothetical protein
MSTVKELILSFWNNEQESFTKSDEEINQEIKSAFGYDAQFQSSWVGGFDSPGYDIDCYAYAYLDDDGKLVLDSWTVERY